MLHFFAGILAFLSSLFGTVPLATTPLPPTTPAPVVTHTTYPSAPTTIINNPTTYQYLPSTSPTAGVTQLELAQKLQALTTDLQNRIAALPHQYSDTSPSTNTLSGTTLTNVRLNGVTGLTVADIPSLSSLYQPLGSDVPASALQKSFTVDTGATITAGDIVAMAGNGNIAKWLASATSGAQSLPTTTGGNTNAPLVVTLDATHFIYAYRDSVNANKLTAVAGFISGTSVTFGTAVVFSNSTTVLAFGAMASTSATSFIISYNDSSDTSKLKIIAGSVSANTTITFGTAVTVSNSVNPSVMVMLDSTHFVLTYRDSTIGNQTYSVAGSVNTSTNVFTMGTSALASANTNGLLTNGLLNGNGGVAALDATHFLIVYRDSVGSTVNQTTAIAASVLGNAITFGAAVATTSTNLFPINNWGSAGPVTLIDSTHFLVTYWDSTNSNRLTVFAGLVSGTTISFGTKTQMSTLVSVGGGNMVTILPDSTHFQLVFFNSAVPTTMAGFLNGTNNLTITAGAAVTGTDAGASGTQQVFPSGIQLLDATHFALTVALNSPNNIKTQVFALSGTNNLTTTAGTAVAVPEASSCTLNNEYFTTSIDSTHFVLTYLPAGCSIRSAEVSISAGTTVTFGTSVVGANTTLTSAIPSTVTKLNSSSYLVTYGDSANASKQSALVGNDSSGTITFGSSAISGAPAQVTLSSSAANVSATIDSTHFVTVFNDTNNSSKLSAAIGTLSGGAVTFGTLTLLATSTTAVTTVELATTTTGFVVAYRDSNNGNKLSVVAASISGTTITAGTPTFNVSATTNNPVMTLFDGTHFVLTYTDSTNSSFLTSIAGTVSGTTLTFGTAVVASNSTTNISGNLNAAAMLDSTHFVLTYVDTTSNNYVAAVVGTISSDTTITFGTSVNTAQTGTPQLAVMDSTHFTLGYVDTTDTTLAQGKLKVVPAMVSGSAITYGSSVVASNSNNTAFLITSLDPTHFVLAYVNSTNTYKGTTKVGALSGANNLTATMGNPAVFGLLLNVGTASFLGSGGSVLVLSAIDSSHFILAFSDTTLSSSNNNSTPIFRLDTVTASISGSTITLGTPTTLSTIASGTGNIYNIWSLPILDSTHAVLMYQDGFNASKITAAPLVLQTVSGNIIGLAAGSGVAGDSVSVFMSGVVTGLSGLAAGAIYYAENDGSLGLTPTAYQVGLALSPTTLLLKSSDTISNTNVNQFFGDAIFANAFRITENAGKAALNFLNQFGQQIASLDENGNLTILGQFVGQHVFGGDATTTASTILTSFANAGDALKRGVASMGDTVIRVLGEAVQATVGIFDSVFARVIHTDTICVSKSAGGEVCLTGDQLAPLFGAGVPVPSTPLH